MDAITLDAYYDLLLAHDWHYEYGDHRAWSKGMQTRRVLEQHIIDSGAHSKLFDAFREFAGGRRANRPDRPG